MKKVGCAIVVIVLIGAMALTGYQYWRAQQYLDEVYDRSEDLMNETMDRADELMEEQNQRADDIVDEIQDELQ